MEGGRERGRKAGRKEERAKGKKKNLWNIRSSLTIAHKYIDKVYKRKTT